MLLRKSTASRCRYTLSSASRRNIAASQCFYKRRQQRRITVRAFKLERDAIGICARKRAGGVAIVGAVVAAIRFGTGLPCAFLPALLLPNITGMKASIRFGAGLVSAPTANW